MLVRRRAGDQLRRHDARGRDSLRRRGFRQVDPVNGDRIPGNDRDDAFLVPNREPLAGGEIAAFQEDAVAVDPAPAQKRALPLRQETDEPAVHSESVHRR